MQRSSFIPNRTWLNKRSRAPAYTSHLVTVPAGYNLQACLTFFGCSPVTRVELELNLGVKVVACWRGELVIWAPRSTRPLVQPCSIGNKGGTLHRSFLGPKTSRLSVQKTTTYGPITVIRAFLRTKWRF